jgi:hypothetical protein
MEIGPIFRNAVAYQVVDKSSLLSSCFTLHSLLGSIGSLALIWKL